MDQPSEPGGQGGSHGRSGPRPGRRPAVGRVRRGSGRGIRGGRALRPRSPRVLRHSPPRTSRQDPKGPGVDDPATGAFATGLRAGPAVTRSHPGTGPRGGHDPRRAPPPGARPEPRHGIRRRARAAASSSPRGDILTSLHVVAGATEIELTFADGTTSPAQVASSEPEHDIAVIRAATPPATDRAGHPRQPRRGAEGSEAYASATRSGCTAR